MKFRFMYDQRHYHRVAKMAEVLGVSRGGYYAWLNGVESTRQIDGRIRSTGPQTSEIPVTTMSKHNHRASPNLVNRNFNPPAAKVSWASDLTYIDTSEGWLYLRVILDLYNRRVIGWSMSHRMGADMSHGRKRRRRSSSTSRSSTTESGVTPI